MNLKKASQFDSTSLSLILKMRKKRGSTCFERGSTAANMLVNTIMHQSCKTQEDGRGYFKEKVEFWGEVKNYLWTLSLLLCKCGRTSEKKLPWKAWLFKCLHILIMTNNSLKMRPDLYATCLCSPIYISLCKVLVLYQDWAKFLIILMTPESCSIYRYLHVCATCSNWFHTVSFTMQSHEQNSTLSLWIVCSHVSCKNKKYKQRIMGGDSTTKGQWFRCCCW